MEAQDNFRTVIRRIAESRNLAGVTRHPIPLDIEQALAEITMLGQTRSEAFRIDAHNRWAYTQLLKWLYADPTMQALDPVAMQQGQARVRPGRLTAGIYLSGSTGTGKSWAMDLLNAYADIDAPAIRLGQQERPLHFGRFRAEDIWEEASASDKALARYKTIPILCIQDLGSEPAGDAVRMGSRREPMRQILEARGDRTDLVTLITSNFNIDAPEIERRYTDRVVSRLKGMCNLLVINGPDRRTF